MNLRSSSGKLLRSCPSSKGARQCNRFLPGLALIVLKSCSLSFAIFVAAILGFVPELAHAADKPNIVMLMNDDTGWNDFGSIFNGRNAGLGHPTPSIGQIAKEGAILTNWYGQASPTASSASFITGRIPIRSAHNRWLRLTP